MNQPQNNRKINIGLIFLSGLIVGGLCYLISEWTIPKNVGNITEHDLILANRIGYIYTSAVGICLGWIQRSWMRTVYGLIVGIIIGIIYHWFCLNADFLAIMVAFPCLLGGLLASLLGSNRSRIFKDFGFRFIKGLFAGFILGIVYMVVLNMGVEMFLPSDEYRIVSYVSAMWRVGPIALGLSSGLFFILVRWAVGLTRVRIIFNDKEDTDIGAA